MIARVLVLAGHDPTGGAGVDADARAVRAAGGEAVCVVTNRTDQDGRRVHAVEPVPLGEWLAGARRAFASRVGAVKTGLLSSSAQVDAVADLVAQWRERRPDLPVVVDPVLAASGGEEFLDADGVGRLLARLPDLSAVLTPNAPEAARLAGLAARELESSVAAREEAARRLLDLGAIAVCVKGGHGREDPVVDLVVERDRSTRLERPRVAGRSLHGSGCRFASFVAARLAAGAPLVEACRGAGLWLQTLLERPSGDRGPGPA